MLKTCRLKLLHYKQYGEKGYSDHPSTVLGNLIHKMYEIASSKKLDDQSFEKHWKEELAKASAQYFKNELNLIYSPIEFWAPYYSIKKGQTKKIILKSAKEPAPNKNSKKGEGFYVEQSFKYGVLKGKPDSVYVKDGYSRLIDFKTGPIYKKQGNQYVIKDEYKIQLKAYGFLVMKKKKISAPRINLILQQVNGQRTEPINFSNEEYENFYYEAKASIDEINNYVDSNSIDLLGSPSESNCKFCLFKPKCHSFLSYLDANNVPYAVIIETPDEIISTNNGIRFHDFYLWGIPPNTELEIRGVGKKKVLICNLSKSNSNNTYYWKKQSQVYII